MHNPITQRMKENYESRFGYYLPRRLPLIIRLDGRAFHSYCRPLKDRYNLGLIEVMNLTAIELCTEIQGAQLAYIQSDEISILLHDYKKLNSSAWFDYNLNKVISISAAIASSIFTMESWRIWGSLSSLRPAQFDSRAFSLPESEVCNYFIDRQCDATRNSINTLGQTLFSHNELQGKSTQQIQDMCFLQHNINWNDLPTERKRGRCVIKEAYTLDGVSRSRWIVDNDIPVFSQDRAYIEDYLKVEE